MRGRWSTVDLRAVALVIVPILLALVAFVWTEHAGPEAGVYVESSDRTIYKLVKYAEGRNLSFDDVTSATSTAPRVGIASFFVVGSRGEELPMPRSAALYMFVVDHGDPHWQPKYVQIPATVNRINPRAYQVKPVEGLRWANTSPINRFYHDALTQTSARRATTDVEIGLVISERGQEKDRLFPVRFGPI
jgi:hypothetical protein